jgi:hypothetical protein
MRWRSRFLVTSWASLAVLLSSGCRQRNLETFVATLPELPQDIAATLDPRTSATRLPALQPPPEKPARVVLAACCGSTDTKTLKVNFTYTKCGPLRDFILVPLGDLVSVEARTVGGPGKGTAADGTRVFRKGELNRGSVLDTIVCITSSGPWNATLIEERYCNGYSPRDTLLINAWGDALSFVWNGGPSNHPTNVGLVSCREVGLVRYRCGGLSTCPCDSAPCPADQPCDCGLQGQW